MERVRVLLQPQRPFVLHKFLDILVDNFHLLSNFFLPPIFFLFNKETIFALFHTEVPQPYSW